ncbi:hypothetical protein RCL1_003105 [Eukaryota sp. TZLM3-RCL]
MLRTFDTNVDTESHFASFILTSPDGYTAIVETSTHIAAPKIIDYLNNNNIDLDKVLYVCVTHLHLDHAGGCGALIQSLPNAKAVVHSAGAKFLIDPSVLNAASRAVYSDAVMDTVMGESVAIPEDRVIPAHDGMELKVGEYSLNCIFTHGHSWTHLCFYENTTKVLFAGDLLGSLFTVNNKNLLVLISSPNQFNPPSWLQSLDKVKELEISKVMLTHFGEVEDVEWIISETSELVNVHKNIAEKSEKHRIYQDLIDYYRTKSDVIGLDFDYLLSRFGDDFRISADGLVYYRNKLEKVQ